jgi:hypothetical protein
VDNFRGLPLEKASSYLPPPPLQRFSDSSVPELCRHRWSVEGEDHSRRLASVDEDFCFLDSNRSSDSMMDSSSQTRAPLVPTRRCSLESLEDTSDETWIGETDDEEDLSSRRRSDNHCEQRLEDTSVSEHEIINSFNNTKRLQSPPKAPERQASLRRLQGTADLPTNLSIPCEDQLDEVQKVHQRRYGVSCRAGDPLTSLLTSPRGYQAALINDSPALVLEKMYREVCITTQDFDDEDDETEHWDNSNDDDVLGEMSNSSQHRLETQINRDSLPSCAKRRPSPQLDKSSFHGCDSTDASPVRAKRRPSPELAAFASLVEALVSVQKQ